MAAVRSGDNGTTISAREAEQPRGAMCHYTTPFDWETLGK